MKEFFWKPKIDSFDLSVPLDECEVIDTSLIEKHSHDITNMVTGEIENVRESQGKSINVFNDTEGTRVRFSIGTQFYYTGTIGNDGKVIKLPKPYITILIQSKHLGKDYFKGITKDTFKNIYEYIMSQKVIYCDYEVFKKGRWNDCDICFDFPGNDVQLDTLKQNIIKSVKDPKYWFSRRTKENTGLWSPTERDPRKNGKPRTPFIKFYNKTLDLETRSLSFSQFHLKGIDYSNVLRCEGTIGRGNHKRRLGLEKHSIWDLLGSDLQILIGQMFREYIEKPKINVSVDGTPMDKVLIDLLNECLSYGVTSTKLFSIFERYDVSDRSRRNLIKKYHEIMNNDKINKDKIEGNNLTKVIFDYLGVTDQHNQIIKERNREDKRD